MSRRSILRFRPPLAAALVSVLASAPALSGQEPTTGRAVMELYDAQDRTRDTQVTMEMTLVDSRGRERHRSLTLQSRTDEGLRKQLIRFLEPGDVEGTAFLTVEKAEGGDDAWLYLPALRRVRRIAGTDKRDRFVGTHFTYEDLDREDLERHAYELVGEEVLDGVATWVVRAEPSDPALREESGYGRRELWISQEHHVLVQAKLYDREGAYVRRLRAEDVRPVPQTDRWRAYRITMEDVREGGRTILRMTQYSIDRGVPEDLFTERYLRRGR